MPSKPRSTELPRSTGRTCSSMGHGCLSCSHTCGAGLWDQEGSASRPACMAEACMANGGLNSPHHQKRQVAVAVSKSGA